MAAVLSIAASGCLREARQPEAFPPVGRARLAGEAAVTPEGTRYVAATFSPDGSMLALAVAGLAAIDVVPADGGGTPRRLVEAERAGYRFAWTRDGQAIVHRHGKNALAVTRLDGASETLVRASVVGFPAVTAGGDVLFSADGELRRLEAMGGKGAKATGQPGPPRGVTAFPTGGAGRGLGAHPGLLTVHAEAAPVVAGWDGERIFVIDTDRNERRDLFVGRSFFDVELSRDGKLALVHESRGAEGHLWIASTDGASRLDLGLGWMGRLSPDGRTVVYVLQENDGARFLSADLWLVTVDGRERRRLTATADTLETAPAFSPLGDRLAYVDAATGRVFVARLEREGRP